MPIYIISYSISIWFEFLQNFFSKCNKFDFGHRKNYENNRMQRFLSLCAENSGCRDQAAIAVAPLPVRDSTCKMPRQSQVPVLVVRCVLNQKERDQDQL